MRRPPRPPSRSPPPSPWRRRRSGPAPRRAPPRRPARARSRVRDRWTRPSRSPPCPPRVRPWSEPHLLGDDLLHDLGGAAADGHEAIVAEEPLDGVLAHVAVAAVELHAVVGHALGHVRGEELHHGDLAHRVLVALELDRTSVGEPAPGLDQRGELGELVTYDLFLG